jgi:predicted Zn-dependent protease
VIVLAPKAKHASAERVLGVLAHEFGHALAFLAGVPGHSERDADAIAEQAFGVQIAYDKDDVQTVGAGTRPRPSRLGE